MDWHPSPFQISEFPEVSGVTPPLSLLLEPLIHYSFIGQSWQPQAGSGDRQVRKVELLGYKFSSLTHPLTAYLLENVTWDKAGDGNPSHKADDQGTRGVWQCSWHSSQVIAAEQPILPPPANDLTQRDATGKSPEIFSHLSQFLPDPLWALTSPCLPFTHWCVSDV